LPNLPLAQLAFLILSVVAFASFGGTLLVLSVRDALSRRSASPARKDAQAASNAPAARVGAAT
jgi:hypothetical protein